MTPMPCRPASAATCRANASMNTASACRPPNAWPASELPAW